MRVGEISAIDIRDFIPIESSFRVRGKGGRERLAYVVDQMAVRLLEEYIFLREQLQVDTPALFLNFLGHRLSPQGIADIIRRIRQGCGIERHITPHMLRHTVATMLLRNGVDLRVVQEFLGHASVMTTQRYTYVSKGHMIAELQNRHPSLTIRTQVKD
jgi:integrase/recombinase XerD